MLDAIGRTCRGDLNGGSSKERSPLFKITDDFVGLSSTKIFALALPRWAHTRCQLDICS